MTNDAPLTPEPSGDKPKDQPDSSALVPADPGGAHAPAIQFSGDQVKAVHEAKGTPSDQIAQLVWFLVHCRQRGVGGNAKMGELLDPPRDGSTISRVYRAIYPSDITPVVESIVAYRRGIEQGPSLDGRVNFVETRLFGELSGFCDLARATQTIGIVWGPNQSGKTWALRAYQERNNHGRTIYVRMPAGGTGRRTLNAIAKACAISERHSYEALCEKIIRFFSPDVLLIVDEAHQAIVSGRTVKHGTLELIREIHDLSGCGVVLCGTDALNDAIRDPAMARFLGQFDNRGVLRRKVNPTPYAEDVTAILHAYGLPVPGKESEEGKLLAKICRENGIGKLCKLFQMAGRLASKKVARFAWSHVLATNATLQQWANGEEGK